MAIVPRGALSLCRSCGVEPRLPGQRWGTRCRTAYARRWRRRYHELTPEQRRRANCRAYSNVLKRRGHLVPQPCEACGSTDVQMHHRDYDDPWNVIWLCRGKNGCHRLHERLVERRGPVTYP